MWILIVYVLIVVVMELIVVAIGLALDRIYPSISLTISLSLFSWSFGLDGLSQYT